MESNYASNAVIPKSRLLDQVRDAVHLRHYSIRIEEAHVQWINRILENLSSFSAPLDGLGGYALPRWGSFAFELFQLGLGQFILRIPHQRLLKLPDGPLG